MKNFKLFATLWIVALCTTLIMSCDNTNDDTEKEKEPETGIAIEDLVNSVWQPTTTFTTQLWKNQNWVYDDNTKGWNPNSIDEPFNVLASVTDSICFGNFSNENNKQLIYNQLLRLGGYKIISITLSEGRIIPDVTYFDINKTMCECSARYPEVNHLGQYYLTIEFEPQNVTYANFSNVVTTTYRSLEASIYFIDKNTFVLTCGVYCGDSWCLKGYYYCRIR